MMIMMLNMDDSDDDNGVEYEPPFQALLPDGQAVQLEGDSRVQEPGSSTPAQDDDHQYQYKYNAKSGTSTMPIPIPHYNTNYLGHAGQVLVIEEDFPRARSSQSEIPKNREESESTEKVKAIISIR